MRLFLPLLIAWVAASPAGAAAWDGPGGPEPDTPQDANWIWSDAAHVDGFVYFNAFEAPPSGVANPNLGPLHARVQEAGPIAYHAYFGVWLDCNDDGYMGSAAGALVDYPAALLPAGSPCADGTAHNAGGWVSELLFLGAVDPCEYDGSPASQCPVQPQTSRNPTVIYHDAARVWGDEGLPGDGPDAACASTPLPAGTTSSTGALLAHLECESGGSLSGSLPSVEPPVTLFHDPQTDHAGILEADSRDPAFTIWDCSARQPLASDPTGGRASGATLRDPSGGALSGPIPTPVGPETLFDSSGTLQIDIADTNGNYAYTPSPALADPTGSYYDGANGALDGQHYPLLPLAGPALPGVPALGTGAGSDCDPSTPTMLDSPGIGGRVEASQAGGPARKTTSDWWLTFTDGFKGLAPEHNPAGLVSPTTPTSDGGLAFFRDSDHGGAAWTSNGRASEGAHLLSRETLGVAPPRHVTFYAYAPSGVGAVPHATARYGEEACLTIGAGVSDSAAGWACDPSSWWRDASGSDVTPRFTNGARIAPIVGSPYNARDVDCYDDSIVNFGGATAGATTLSPTTC